MENQFAVPADIGRYPTEPTKRTRAAVRMSKPMSDNERRVISVFHVDPFTGIVLEPTPPFENYSAAPNRNCVEFDSESDAIRYCKETVACHPHVQCVVHGLPDDAHCEFGDRPWVEAESKRRMERSSQLARDLERRHQRDRLLLAGFATAILIGLLLLIRFGG